MRPYLLRSFGLHIALGIVLAILSARATLPKSNPVYSIDFVGPSGGIIQSLRGPAPAPAALASPRVAPQAQVDEFTTKKRRPGQPLPRPSLLRGYTEKPAPAQTTAAPAATSAGSGAGGGEAGVSTDMANFPYPWYISQVRAELWSRWSERMPNVAAQAVIVFTILPTGQAVDVRTEESSGDSAFDLIALSAVQGGSFPPLPRAFEEPFLKVHVTLKSQ